LLASCGSKDNDVEDTWDKLFHSEKLDPIKEYTAIIYSHSKQADANFSLKTVDACTIGPEGIDQYDLTALIELDPTQAKECWSWLINYQQTDKRFFNPETPEYEAWQNFLEKKDKYEMFFNQNNNVK